MNITKYIRCIDYKEFQKTYIYYDENKNESTRIKCYKINNSSNNLKIQTSRSPEILYHNLYKKNNEKFIDFIIKNTNNYKINNLLDLNDLNFDRTKHYNIFEFVSRFHDDIPNSYILLHKLLEHYKTINELDYILSNVSSSGNLYIDRDPYNYKLTFTKFLSSDELALNEYTFVHIACYYSPIEYLDLILSYFSANIKKNILNF